MRSTGRLLLLRDREPPLCHKSHLETVSTIRGSGWVAIPKCEIAIDHKYDRFTHPLPRTVLTVSKLPRMVLTVSKCDLWQSGGSRSGKSKSRPVDRMRERLFVRFHDLEPLPCRHGQVVLHGLLGFRFIDFLLEQ